MPKSIITDFSVGEASARMEGRFDLPEYQRACRTLQNMILDSRGGADRRPGLEYVATCIAAGTASRLIEFEYNSTTSFLLELSNGALRIYNSDGTVHTSSVGSPTWTTAQLFQISYAQAGNVMYFTMAGLAGVHELTYTPGTDSFALVAAKSFTGITFTAADDVPSALTFHEGRLIMLGTNNDPMAVWGSRSVDPAVGSTQYDDFTLGTTATHAWKYVIATDKGDQLKWGISSRDLLLGSFGAEYTVTGYDAGITPTNVYIKRQSKYGSKTLQAFLVGDAAVYVRRNGKKVMEQIFTREGGGYNSRELNFLAHHIAGDGFIDISYQGSPDSTLWYITDDGSLVGVTYNREFGVQGWHRHVTDGEFESVAVLDAEGEDQVWVTVKRTVNGATVRYIERMKPRDWGTDRKDAFFVDSGYTWNGATEVGAAGTISSITKSATAVITIDQSYADGSLIQITDCDVDDFENAYQVKNRVGSGPYSYDLYTEDGTSQIDSSLFSAAATSGTATPVLKTVSGLSHLEGKSVIALRDGASEEEATVSGGQVTLSSYGNKIHVGLKYTSIVEPMKASLAPGERNRINRLLARFYNAQAMRWGPTVTDTEPVSGTTGVMGQAPDLISRDIEAPFGGDWTTEATMVILNESPQPMSVLAIIADVTISGGR